MVQSAYSAPHVSVWTDVDASRTMELVKRLKASPDFADIRVSPLLIMARAVIWAARRTPMVNAAWVDGENGAEIKVRRYVNLGIAAATPRGLLVPNIKDAQNLKMRDLARALEKLTLTAREGKTTPADQHGGTITITNIGVFGMDAGTPIINPGEAGIVALGTIRQKPWVVDGEVRPRWVTTVAGSFDHRVVDGDGMSRFIADVASILEEPALLLDRSRRLRRPGSGVPAAPRDRAEVAGPDAASRRPPRSGRHPCSARLRRATPYGPMRRRDARTGTSRGADRNSTSTSAPGGHGSSVALTR
jgi:2-oxoisovalerate dehydrogenase E2 component (dihydrolipoyl transacylase)